MSKIRATLPETGDFRSWLSESISRLETTPAQVCAGAGLSVNALGYFLKKRDASIRLETAHKVASFVAGAAAKQGIELPELGQ